MRYSDFFTESGRINSGKLKEEWLKKHAPDFFKEVNDFIIENGMTVDRTVEKLWYYFNGISKKIACKNERCSNSTKFYSLDKGFAEYCSYSCSNGSISVKNKKEQSYLKKFGVANPFQAKDIIKKIEETHLKKLGVRNAMQSSSIKSKMIQRSIEKNGTPWALSKGGKANLRKKENLKTAFELKYPDLELLEYSDEKFGTCKFKKALCDHVFTINKWQLHQRASQGVETCTVCNPIGSFNETLWQNEVASFLGDLGVSFIEKDRKVLRGLELDFYLPEERLAIELDGLYWHSIRFKDPKYHQNKTDLCESNGIQLIHVFEDEWIYKKEIVKSRLENLVGKSSRRIFARKCEVRSISESEAASFITTNHIQGNVISSKRFGLYFNDELVSVMTFGPLRRALGAKPINGEYEMYRFCNKAGTNVTGAASKLLKRFILEENPAQIISYADRRWSTGNLYEKIGFELVKRTEPNFWYVESDRRVHRFKYTKKNLAKKLGSDVKKEEQLAKLGLEIIFDSGNLKFRLTCK